MICTPAQSNPLLWPENVWIGPIWTADTATHPQAPQRRGHPRDNAQLIEAIRCVHTLTMANVVVAVAVVAVVVRWTNLKECGC